MKRQSRCVPVTTLAFIAWGLAGCGGGVNLAKIDDDPTLITGSIAPSEAKTKAAPDPFGSAVEDELQSDREAIIGMVTAADLSTHGEEGLAWRNAKTGASGQIDSIREKTEGGVTCRQFTVSRQTYQGVALWTGEACRGALDEWMATRFQRV
ncbi:RT0821/Lpp0805 family surface protein [Notoacmeibacter ruber]|uniref:Surface antigen domain-containing protein n=1 Tax=Notoacmeibacter ruber TaxID=2670375 RepID=A0A3L7J9L5_9HYPH|nr:RT0821/Lpp0805 family surface protein [Notoacmeibacter ruber]RLQ87438.1 hypothetical protein D8780_03680 [Notoacmeibacter ruber]